MSNTTVKHTPGPWYVLRGQRNISIRHKTGDKRLPMVNVASVRGNLPDDCPYGSSKANASLIAAAPDLLEALKAMTEQTNSTELAAACDKARAAIAKATGTTP